MGDESIDLTDYDEYGLYPEPENVDNAPSQLARKKHGGWDDYTQFEDVLDEIEENILSNSYTKKKKKHKK